MTEKKCGKIMVCSVEELLEMDLKIPYYQRPYRWHAEKHVDQLLQDLTRETSIPDNVYRLGTVLIHHHNTHDIVDGQQRLVTLSLLLHALNSELKGILENEFKHIDSKNNIKYNYQYIERYLRNKSKEEKDQLKDFILNNCNLLVITVTELGEAFQLFDSQNARGKALDPADLLKAFHLREMEQVYEAEKRRFVNHWEKAIEKGYLNDIIGNYLFRLRSWRDNKKKYFFSKDEIETFKGINPYRMLRDGKKYPYVSQLLAQSSIHFYQYHQPIINGKWFFQFISHYLDKVERIEEICLEENRLKLNYNGSHRIGDKRLLKLYKNLLFVYLDRYGEDSSFKRFKIMAFRWVFATRIEKKQIRYQTIINKIVEKQTPIKWIEKSYMPEIDKWEMTIDSIKRFEHLRMEDEGKTSRKRIEFKEEGLYCHLCLLEKSDSHE